jgi:hypothetical protein
MSKNENTIIAELRAKVAELQAEVKASKRTPKLTAKVSPHGSGCVCLYGLQRMPVSLRPAQWERLFEEGAGRVRKCVEENKALLDEQVAASKAARNK